MVRATRFAWVLAAMLGLALAACGEYKAVYPAPVLVTGRVIDAWLLPIPGVRVAAGSMGAWEATATTGDDGRFALRVASVPYDLGAVDTSGTAWVYQGVTRTDPTVNMTYGGQAPAKIGRIHGTIAGTSCQVLSSIIAFEPGPNGLYWPAGGTFDVWAGWTGTDQMAGTLRLLCWGAATPTAPPPYWCDALPVEAVAGTTVTVTFAAPPACQTDSLSGTVSAPSGVTVDGSVWVGHSIASEPLTMFARSAVLSSGAFATVIPAAPGIRTNVNVSGSSAAGEVFLAGRHGVVPGTTDLFLTLRPAPVLLKPAEGASAGAGTRFAWWPAASVVHQLIVGPIVVLTNASEARLPDPSALGVAYPVNATKTWSVMALGQCADVDACLAPPLPGPRDFWNSTSVSRSVLFP